MIKSVLRKLLGERTLGTLEYYLKPSLKASWGGPMNGQAFRRKIYQELLAKLPLQAIIETGTFRGTTTEYFAASGLPVFTAEASDRYHAFAQLRLREVEDLVSMYEGDSRDVLRTLAQDPAVPKDYVLFYLDAHWEEDLPLREEVEIIFSTWHHAVVLVDDFAVPGSTYAYDDYGNGKALTLDYLKPLGSIGLRTYFPALPAEEETGARRGCVVLCADAEVEAVLDEMETLVSHAAQTTTN